MEQINTIPKELLCIVPKFDGDEGLLNLFLKKAEYVHSAYVQPTSSPAQKLYVFHSLSSRLSGRAANLLSERNDICAWDRLTEILIQHFGDPRSEECIAIELEQLKIKSGESYIELCHRIQHTRSTLFAKVNLLTDEGVKAAKMIVYNNLALNVFLYNLPEDLIRIVRLKGCTNLESALSIVTEEVNFMIQYNAKNKMRMNFTPHKPQLPFNSMPAATPNFKFGIPQHNQHRFQIPSQPPKFGIPPQQNQPQGFRFNQPTGFRPNLQGQPTGFKFNPQNQNQPTGYRFNPNQQNFRFGIPQQGYRPTFNNNFQRPPLGYTPQQNFKFGIPNQQFQFTKREPVENTDVSMRTARPFKQNTLEVPDMTDNEHPYYIDETPESLPDQYNDFSLNYCDGYYEYNQDMSEMQTHEENNATCNYIATNSDENFMTQASTSEPK